MRSLIIILALLLAGCSSPERWAEVESDTSWSGYFENRSVDGHGDQRIDLPESGEVVCAVVQKDTEDGYLRLRLCEQGVMLTPKLETEWARTTAAYGIVDRCLD